MGRARRRRDSRRMKRRARKLYPLVKRPEKFANNLTACSCMHCGNPRQHWKRKTRQEEIAELESLEIVDELISDICDNMQQEHGLFYR